MATNNRTQSKNFACYRLLTLSLLLLWSPAALLAQTDIGDGKLFKCSDGLIISTKSQEVVSAVNAKKKIKALIARYSKKIASLPQGSKARSRLIQKRKSVRQGLKDIKTCIEANSDNPLLGTWNLILENGQTPTENGYNSLMLSFSSSEFNSNYDGNSFDCLWTGSYLHNEDFTSITLQTTAASGNDFCNQAINQSQTAVAELSPDGNQLTLDYRASSGALQIYEKVSE